MCCERWSNEAATVHADITLNHHDVPANLNGCPSVYSKFPVKGVRQMCTVVVTCRFAFVGYEL